MSRFVAPDLSALGALPLVSVDFEAREAARVEYYKAALEAFGVPYDIQMLETDPMRVAFSEGGAFHEMLIDQRINEAIGRLSLASAQGAALDHIAATYYGISRQMVMDADGNGTPEPDERFRARIALAPEAFSTAGPEGAYTFHALELDGVQDIADAATYSEEDGAIYSAGAIHADAFTRGKRSTPFAGRDDGDPVLAPEVLVVILPIVAYGPADQALVDRAWDAETAADIRPIGDNVRVEAAEVVDYAIDMTIAYAPGSDPVPLVEAVRKALVTYTDKRRRVGLKAERLGIGGCGYVSGVEAVTLKSPTTDIGGGSKQAPNCTGINVVAVQAAGNWQ